MMVDVVHSYSMMVFVVHVVNPILSEYYCVLEVVYLSLKVDFNIIISCDGAYGPYEWTF